MNFSLFIFNFSLEDAWAKQRYTYTPVEYSTLKSIADASPEQKGPAVYNARVMLMILPGMTFRFMNEEEPGNNENMNDSIENKVGIPYPNPAMDQFSFEYSMSNESKGFICLYDIMGRMVLKEELLPDNTMITISTSGINHGIYLFEAVIDNVCSWKGKLIIVK